MAHFFCQSVGGGETPGVKDKSYWPPRFHARKVPFSQGLYRPNVPLMGIVRPASVIYRQQCPTLQNHVVAGYSGLYAGFEKPPISCGFVGCICETVCRLMTPEITILAIKIVLRLHTLGGKIMSVLIADDNNIISIPVSTERYFNSVWEKAIQELSLKYIGNSRPIYYRDLPQILDDFMKVRSWAEINLYGVDLDYVISHIDNILEYLPASWNENRNIQELWMG